MQHPSLFTHFPICFCYLLTLLYWLMPWPPVWKHTSPHLLRCSLLLNLGLTMQAPWLFKPKIYRIYKDSPSQLSLYIYRSAWNFCAIRIPKAKSSFYENMSEESHFFSYWQMFLVLSQKSNNFCNLPFLFSICSDGSTACSPTNKANLFGCQFCINSLFKDSHAPDPTSLLLSYPISSPIISTCKVSPRGCWWAGSRSLPTFRLIHKSWTYPSTWKNALVQPVPMNLILPTTALLL